MVTIYLDKARTTKCAAKPRARCHLYLRKKHTDESKDVADGGHEDNEQVDQEDETKRDAAVYVPAERLFREEDLEQSPADLQRERRKEGDCH